MVVAPYLKTFNFRTNADKLGQWFYNQCRQEERSGHPCLVPLQILKESDLYLVYFRYVGAKALLLQSIMKVRPQSSVNNIPNIQGEETCRDVPRTGHKEQESSPMDIIAYLTQWYEAHLVFMYEGANYMVQTSNENFCQDFNVQVEQGDRPIIRPGGIVSLGFEDHDNYGSQGFRVKGLVVKELNKFIKRGSKGQQTFCNTQLTSSLDSDIFLDLRGLIAEDTSVEEIIQSRR